jgi:hypothetical protein
MDHLMFHDALHRCKPMLAPHSANPRLIAWLSKRLK